VRLIRAGFGVGWTWYEIKLGSTFGSTNKTVRTFHVRHDRHDSKVARLAPV
jgi:hypothetical protein